MGIWYEISSSASGTALRIASRTSFRTACTSLGFEAMYSFTDLKFVLAIGRNSLRTTQRVIIGSNAARLGKSKKLHDPAQRIGPCVLAHGVWTNKDAGVLERKRRDVIVKRFGLAIHKQILFDIGKI